MLYNVTTRQQFLSIPCGGGHRAWDFHMSCDHPGSSAQLTAKLVHIQSREVLLSTALLQSKHYMLKVSNIAILCRGETYLGLNDLSGKLHLMATLEIVHSFCVVLFC